MLRFDEVEEVFFDIAESFSSEENFVVGEELVLHNFDYNIWLNELKSVEERRESFLIRMGFREGSSSNGVALDVSETVKVGRIVECSGAVTSSHASSLKENLVCDGRESNGEANFMVEESGQEVLKNLSTRTEGETTESPRSGGELGCCKMQAHVEDFKGVDKKKKKSRGWLRSFICKIKKSRAIDASKVQKVFVEGKVTRMKVQHKKKRCMELTAVCAGQEIRAHKGLVWTMKFSPDGHYLASGGEDGIIRIWSVSSVEASCTTSGCNFQSNNIEVNSSIKKKKSRHAASVVIPEKVFQINDSPLHEFHGHTCDILDLAWSTSNHLLSSSKDGTVRLWQVGSNKCLSVFLHKNYVTCIQFNPLDENYFISGSVDGKVRIWGVSEKRVVDWADTQDIVTAVRYQPNAKGFVTGFLSGACRFYEVSGNEHFLHAELQICGKKKSSGNRITGIQFLDNDSRRVMITSEDSKIRILDGLDIIHKYKGLTKSGSQSSASFISSGRHIISIGEDSRIYVWNYDNTHIQPSKAKKSARSCEHFFSEGVSVAIPWSGVERDKRVVAGDDRNSACLQTHGHEDLYSSARDQDRFSLASWFSMDISAKGSATWPEEKLPLWEEPYSEQHSQSCDWPDDHVQQVHHQNNSRNCVNFPATWGLVFVTAGSDGMIRTFHNFGLPIKIK